jgi:hypothetical protein
MRTDMTKNVGYGQYWDTGGGLHFFSTDLSLFNLPHSRDTGGSRRLSHPFIDTFTIAMTGQYWAPRGARCILLYVRVYFN